MSNTPELVITGITNINRIEVEDMTVDFNGNVTTLQWGDSKIVYLPGGRFRMECNGLTVYHDESLDGRLSRLKCHTVYLRARFASANAAFAVTAMTFHTGGEHHQVEVESLPMHWVRGERRYACMRPEH